jgi:hypothetical protein
MMRIPLSSSAVAMIGVLALASPVGLAAQARQRGTASVQGQAVPRSEARSGGRDQAPAAQAETPRAAEPARSAAPPRVAPPRRLDFPEATAVQRSAPRVIVPQVVVPQVIQPRIQTVRPNDRPAYRPDYRGDYRPNYRPEYRPQYQPNYRTLYRPDYRPTYRPYYTFLPRVRLGFGLWIGYPVRYPTYFYPYPSYPYVYTYPYPTPAPYPATAYPATGYPATGYPVPGTLPGAGTSAVGAAGGLSFEITPPEAGVYVDGLYIGTVGQFTPNQPPLSLAPGRHHVEIREPGFEVIVFDVDILPGQVIPYRGELQRF